MNLILEMQKYIVKTFKEKIGINLYNYEIGEEKYPFGTIQNIALTDTLLFPSKQLYSATLHIFSNQKSNTEIAIILQKVKNAFNECNTNILNYKVISVPSTSTKLTKNKDGNWIGLIDIKFSIINYH